MNSINYRIDNLQYCNWSEKIFKINRKAKLDAIHVTVAYHEDFDEVLKNIKTWNNHFKKSIFQVRKLKFHNYQFF